MSKKLRLLHLSWRDHYHPKAGGAEVAGKEIYLRLSDELDITWISAENPHRDSFERIDGINYLRFGKYYSIHWHAWLFLRKNAKDFDVIVDELHGYPFFSGNYSSKPGGIVIYEVAGQIWQEMWSLPIAFIGSLIEKFIYKLVQKRQFITSSESTKLDLQKLGISEKNIQVTKLGIDIPLIDRVVDESKDNLICFVGRICTMKGITQLLNAVAIVKNDIPDLKLALIGKIDPDYESELFSTIDELNLTEQVILPGYVTQAEKADWLTRSKYLVSCSVKEGFGLVVVEAAGRGTPSITFDVNAYRDLITNNVNGFLISNIDIEAFANQLKAALILKQSEYRQLQINARNSADQYSWDNAAAEYKNWLRQLLEFPAKPSRLKRILSIALLASLASGGWLVTRLGLANKS